MKADIENGVGAVEDAPLATIATVVKAMLQGTHFVLVCFNEQGGASYISDVHERRVYRHVLQSVLANLDVTIEGLDDRAQNN